MADGVAAAAAVTGIGTDTDADGCGCRATFVPEEFRIYTLIDRWLKGTPEPVFFYKYFIQLVAFDGFADCVI